MTRCGGLYRRKNSISVLAEVCGEPMLRENPTFVVMGVGYEPVPQGGAHGEVTVTRRMRKG